MAFLRLLFAVKGQMKERGGGNELREIGKGRGERGAHRKQNYFSLCPVQSLKVILKNEAPEFKARMEMENYLPVHPRLLIHPAPSGSGLYL